MKHQEACVKAVANYGEKLRRVKELTEQLKDALCKCPSINPDDIRAVTHLGSYYARATKTSGADLGDCYERAITSKEQLKEACPHCYEAHLIVQKRKVAKIKLGAAKGWVTKLAKKMEGEKATERT